MRVLVDGSDGRVASVDRGRAARRTLAALGVAAVAAAYFAVGIRWQLGWPRGWIDSGLVVYGGWRVGDGGALPYRDFDHVYGPALFFLNGLLLRAFGADLAVVSASLVVLKAVMAAVVWALARTVAGARVAAGVTLLFVVVWGAPLWVFAAPYAQHYGCLAGLVGLLLLARRPRPRGAVALAGACAGVAATFKLTSGLFALLPFVLSALARTQAGRPGGPPAAGGVRAARIAVAVGALATGLLYALASVPRAAAAASVPTVALVAAAFAWTAGAVVVGELRRAIDAEPAAAGVREVATLVAGAAVPALAWIAFYAAHGALGPLARDLLALPPRLQWFEPLPMPSLTSILVVATAAVAAATAGLRRVAPAVALVYVAGWLAVTLGSAARRGVDAAAVLGLVGWEVAAWLPVLCVLPAAALARPLAPDDAARATPRLHLRFAAANLLLLLPAADVWHALMALPACLPLLAHLLAARPRPATRVRRALAAAPLAVVVLAALPFVRQLATTPAAWRGATARFVRASGITHPAPKFADVAALVRHLDADVPPDRPLFVLTGEAMIYFLAGRRSALEHEEYLMQTLVRGAATPASCALLSDDRRFARALAAARPLLVDDVGHPAQAGLERFFPHVARLVRTRYRVVATFGSYQLLDRRPGTGRVFHAEPQGGRVSGRGWSVLPRSPRS